MRGTRTEGETDQAIEAQPERLAALLEQRVGSVTDRGDLLEQRLTAGLVLNADALISTFARAAITDASSMPAADMPSLAAFGLPIAVASSASSMQVDRPAGDLERHGRGMLQTPLDRIGA